MEIPNWAKLVGVVGVAGLGYYLYKRQKSKKSKDVLAAATAVPVAATGATACQKTAASINRARGNLARLKPAWLKQCKQIGGQVVYVRSATGANQQACICK